MAKADNCDNPYPNAADVEREVEDCVKQFSIKLSNQSQEEENNIKIIQDAICSSERKLRNLYNLYSDNPSEILVESINTEESKLKKLKETLISEQKLEKGNLKAKTEQIRKSTEIWNELTTSERNKLLKEIIEKIIITNGNISIYFKTV
jgi:hypothetical protein